MLRRFLFGALVVSLASLATAGVPDLNTSTASIDPAADGANVFVVPNATGAAFTEAKVQQGGGGNVTVDATITVTLRDTQGNLIFGYPFEDMWLETDGGGLAYCEGGTVADGSTDVNGETEWVNPLAGGGNSFGEFTQVYVAGSPLAQTLNITYNSADINGDLQINLTDVNLFTPMLTGYDQEGDYNNDGSVNLTDVNLFVPAIGTGCN